MAEAAGEETVAKPVPPAPPLPATDQGQEGDASPVASPSPTPTSTRRLKGWGLLARLWKGVFGSRNEDFEKKLQHLSKEEASVHARLKRRAVKSRKLARNIIVLAGIIEALAVAFAIMTLRSLDLSWIMKTVRCLPAILSPALFYFIYTAVIRFTKMLDRKDQKTLAKLRAERKAKLDELKERTNYYTTQQLIQRYDLDPAAKAAATSILASKLGSESGIKVFLGDDLNVNLPSARSNDVELAPSSGLRNRKQPNFHSNNNGGSSTPHSTAEMHNESEHDPQIMASQSQVVVEHYRGPSPNEGGWIGRLAALLVGEDPTNCYALICGNCLKHNGLARREDFPHIMYYCPHCHALNTSRRTVELESGTLSPSGSVDGGLLRSFSNSSSCAAGDATPLTSTTPTAAAAAAAAHELTEDI